MSELALTATVKESSTVETEERRQTQHKTQLYRLKVILAVGYHFKRKRGPNSGNRSPPHRTCLHGRPKKAGKYTKYGPVNRECVSQ